jgi:hypothetical protein
MGSGSIGTQTLGAAAKSSAKSFAVTGAISGGANYTIDCAVDGKEFKTKEFASEVIVNAAVGAATGGVVGSVSHGVNATGIIKPSGSVTSSTARTIAKRSFATTRSKLVNKAIRDVAA